MPRRHLLVATTLMGIGSTPELGDAPFSCSREPAGPDGYVCRATACVRESAAGGPARLLRSTWIDPGEMTSMPRPGGGAALIVNDGFASRTPRSWRRRRWSSGATSSWRGSNPSAPRPRFEWPWYLHPGKG